MCLKSKEILKKYWGFDDFRLNQSAIVESTIAGRDTFALLPTGGGKSICFQVPALAKKGICIVVSPLIALMQDQVKNLSSRGVKAQCITSGMTRKEIDIILDNAKYGDLKFLYVSPERLKTPLFLTRYEQMNVSLIAIDEAHCISEWGHDFRPSYKEIYKLREINKHKDVPIIALTATATERVKEDVKKQLQLRDPQCFEGDFNRANISYEVYAVEDKRSAIMKACKKFQGLSGIVYCQTRRSTKEITRFLIANGFSAGIYNGGMDNKSRNEQLKAWMTDKIKIMVATNAFGMGIDKPDVRFVLHYEIPNNLEAYFQEAGRSGRDGKVSRNLAFYEEEDILKLEENLSNRFPDLATVKIIYRALCNHFSIAIGSGTNETYSLDLKTFIKKYDFNLITCYSALKILELNETIVLNEAFFHPTRLKFAVENKTLYDFQLRYEQYTPITALLSRSYPGIFSNFFEVDEDKIAKRLKINKNELKKQLEFLEKQGIIDINWQSQSPQVTFLHERLPDDYFRIQKEVYDVRKKVATDKLKHMIHFLKTPKCRSILLLAYFGQEGKPCGKCDVCLLEEKTTYTNAELSDRLKELITKKGVSTEELIGELNTAEERQVHTILNWLIDEGQVRYQDGVYYRL